MSDEIYTIRPAEQRDLPRLPEIERAAASLFRNTAYSYLSDDDPVSQEVDLEHELVWVIVDQADQAIGFAIFRPIDIGVHLHELDIDPRYGRRGLGRRLIEAFAEWSKQDGASALTLSTFEDLAWNGPYYARLGFVKLNDEQLSPDLQAIRRTEAEAGLPIQRRICMKRDLTVE